jgi:hypothetical protein
MIPVVVPPPISAPYQAEAMRVTSRMWFVAIPHILRASLYRL